MLLQSLKIENFRNHRLLKFEPVKDITLLYGHNGSGKTSILEGIHYCAITKGFNNVSDNECLRFSADYFLLDGKFYSENDILTTVKVVYSKEKEKRIIVDNDEIKKFSSHIGRIPCITFAPSEINIVNGAPVERRRFIDNAISQINRQYLDDLLAYRRVLQQRNALLVQMQVNNCKNSEILEIWTESISRLSAAIVYQRILFLSAFYPLFQDLIKKLSIYDNPSIIYRSSIGKISSDTSFENLYAAFISRYKETEREEIKKGISMTGPHRDDYIFLLNNREIKKYASQGQLRIFLISLKLTQYLLYSEVLKEKPLCLLDDLFSELDASHINSILKMLETCGQTIITSAEKKEDKHLDAISMDFLMKENQK